MDGSQVLTRADGGLFSLLMQDVLTAPPAILLNLKLFGCFSLVPRLVVITALALGAGQRDLFSHERLFPFLLVFTR